MDIHTMKHGSGITGVTLIEIGFYDSDLFFVPMNAGDMLIIVSSSKILGQCELIILFRHRTQGSSEITLRLRKLSFLRPLKAN